MLTVNFAPFPELSTERLVLRQVNESDAEKIFSLRSDERVMQFIDRPVAVTIADALQYIERINNSLNAAEGITWAITLKEDPSLIGTIGFWRIEKEHYRAEIGYLLNHSFHRKGIMQEAMIVVLAYGFKIIKLHSIMANVNPANLASIKLLERNNFTREGYFKESFFFNGRFLDTAIYSLVTTEIKNGQS
jgi:ribosomal-protein-alanine N-acetyltransferase